MLLRLCNFSHTKSRSAQHNISTDFFGRRKGQSTENNELKVVVAYSIPHFLWGGDGAVIVLRQIVLVSFGQGHGLRKSFDAGAFLKVH